MRAPLTKVLPTVGRGSKKRFAYLDLFYSEYCTSLNDKQCSVNC